MSDARFDEVVARLTAMNECVRVYLLHDGEVRPGWLEEEVAMTDDTLAGLLRADEETVGTPDGG